jgi:hypothetical protein
MEAVRDAIDAGVGSATMEIGTTGFAVTVATLTLADPASSVAGSVLTILGVPIGTTATGTGAPVEGRIKDPSGSVVVSGLTVGTSGADIIISSSPVTSGDTVTLTAGTITHG